MNVVETLESCSANDGFSGSFPLLVVLIGYVVIAYYDGLNRINFKAVGLAIIPLSIYFSTHGCWDMQYATYGMWASISIAFILIIAQIFGFLEYGKNTILLVGAAGSGKSTFTYGLVNEYRRDQSCSFSDGTDSDYRVLFQEMESVWALGKAHQATSDINSNRINFNVGYGKFPFTPFNIPGEKQISIYDFGGEQLRSTAPIGRKLGENYDLYELTELQVGQAESEKYVAREEINHIVFLIGPNKFGKYPDPLHIPALQSNIDLILKLTMRTGNAKRDKKYTPEVRKYYSKYRDIKVHCFLTKASRQTREDGSVAVEVLYDIAPELGRLVNDTKGTVKYINVIDENFNPDPFSMSIIAKELKK